MHVDDRIFFSTPTRGLDPARVTIVTPPAVEPWLVSDTEVAVTFKRDSGDDDALVTLVLKASREFLEQVTGVSLINQTLRATFDRLPSRNGCTLREVELPRAPLVSIASVKYLDTNGAEQTFSSASYSAVNADTRPAKFGRLALKPDYDWPDLGDYAGAFYINFVAGFGAAASSISSDLRFAHLMLAKYWFEQSQAAGTSFNPSAVEELPGYLQAMLSNARVAFIA